MTDTTRALMLPTAQPSDAAEAMAWTLDLEAAKAVVNDRLSEVRAFLEDQVHTIATMQGGGGVTIRPDGGQVVLTDPKPQGRVHDREALAGWLYDNHEDDETLMQRRTTWSLVATSDDVEALKATADSIAQRHGGDATVRDFAKGVSAMCHRADEVVLAEDVIGLLESKGHAKVAKDRVVDTASGERVPGTEVVTARQQVQVRPDRAEVAARADAIRASLGLVNEVEA